MKTKLTLIAIALFAIAPLASAASVNIESYNYDGYDGWDAPIWDETMSSGDIEAALGSELYLIVTLTPNTVGALEFTMEATGDLALVSGGFEPVYTRGVYQYMDVAALGGGLGLDVSPVAFADGKVTYAGSVSVGSVHPGGTIVYGLTVQVGTDTGRGSIIFTNAAGAYDAADGINTPFGAEEFAGMNVNVPEPMTMGLLGLGGLFLARRKKA